MRARLTVTSIVAPQNLDSKKADFKVYDQPMMRKHYTPAFKAQIVQEVLKENKTISAIASAHGIHPNQISAWKATVLSGMASLLTSEQQAATVAKEEHEREVQQLYAEIGRLQTQLNWLKKKSGISVPS